MVVFSTAWLSFLGGAVEARMLTMLLDTPGMLQYWQEAQPCSFRVISAAETCMTTWSTRPLNAHGPHVTTNGVPVISDFCHLQDLECLPATVVCAERLGCTHAAHPSDKGPFS